MHRKHQDDYEQGGAEGSQSNMIRMEVDGRAPFIYKSRADLRPVFEESSFRSAKPLDGMDPMSHYYDGSSTDGAESVSLQTESLRFRSPPALTPEEMSQDRKSILGKIRKFRGRSHHDNGGRGSFVADKDEVTTLHDDGTTVYTRTSICTEKTGGSGGLSTFLMKASWWQRPGRRGSGSSASDWDTVASSSTAASSSSGGSFKPSPPIIRSTSNRSMSQPARPPNRKQRPFMALDGGGVYYPKPIFGGARKSRPMLPAPTPPSIQRSHVSSRRETMQSVKSRELPRASERTLSSQQSFRKNPMERRLRGYGS